MKQSEIEGSPTASADEVNWARVREGVGRAASGIQPLMKADGTLVNKAATRGLVKDRAAEAHAAVMQAAKDRDWDEALVRCGARFWVLFLETPKNRPSV